jgi:hypothetical protein
VLGHEDVGPEPEIEPRPRALDRRGQPEADPLGLEGPGPARARGRQRVGVARFVVGEAVDSTGVHPKERNLWRRQAQAPCLPAGVETTPQPTARRRGRGGGSRPSSPCRCTPLDLTAEGPRWGQRNLHRGPEAMSGAMGATFSGRPSAAGPRSVFSAAITPGCLQSTDEATRRT